MPATTREIEVRREHRTRRLRPRNGFAAALALAGGSLLAACAGDSGGGDAAVRADAGAAPASAAAAARSADAWFQAAVAGDVELAIEGGNALAGAMYGRYHISLSGQPAGDGGPVVISLARPDTAPPGAGSYALGESGDFDGNVEIHPGPDDYAIESGELVITAASGDALEGRYTLSARERAGSAGITVEGGFRTRAVD